ncbi:hypothetical protein F4802DRAFT_145432 [Xylaria palmicola]|nr:hypothetical protein F4802DRAFT_145432 [Xylaria palmicola]
MNRKDISWAEAPVEQEGQRAKPESSSNGFTTAVGSEDSDVSSSITKLPPPLLYRPFPTAMKIYYQWNLAGIKVFHVCGTDQHDRIFAVEVHRGYSMSAPLGVFPGLYLYNGPSTKDSRVAAFGQEHGLHGLTLNNENVIYFRRGGSSPWKWEAMRAHTTPKPDHNVYFRFGLDVGRGKHRRRETFEWRRVKRSERDDSTQNGGFKLLWLSLDPEHSGQEGGGSSQSAATDGDESEVVATFSWHSFLTSPKHPFDLTITEDAQFTKLGERCTLMVLITALGLWWLHAQGKTRRGPVAVREKVEGKGKSVA